MSTLECIHRLINLLILYCILSNLTQLYWQATEFFKILRFMLIWRESSCLVFASRRKVFANQGGLGGAERLARGWSDCPIIFQIIWLADYFGLETSPQDYYRLASGRVVSGCFSSYIRLFLAVNLDFRFGAFSFKEDVIVNCQATSLVNLHRIYLGGLKKCCNKQFEECIWTT